MTVQMAPNVIEPRHEKTYLREFATAKTQTDLLSYKD